MQPFNLGILKYLGSILVPRPNSPFSILSFIFAIYMIMLGKAQGCKRAWLRDRCTRGRPAKKRSVDASLHRLVLPAERRSLPEPLYLDNSTRSGLDSPPDLKPPLKINIQPIEPTENPKNQTRDLPARCNSLSDHRYTTTSPFDKNLILQILHYLSLSKFGSGALRERH